MSNRWGTRWRGKIPIPKHAHPLVRRLIEEANRQKTTLREIGDRAGMPFETISDWRYRRNPSLIALEAAFNALDLTLIVASIHRKGGEDDTCRETAVIRHAAEPSVVQQASVVA